MSPADAKIFVTSSTLPVVERLRARLFCVFVFLLKVRNLPADIKEKEVDVGLVKRFTQSWRAFSNFVEWATEVAFHLCISR